MEVAIAIHRVLENSDRLRQCPDFVGALEVRHVDLLASFGDTADRRGNGRERPHDRADDDQDAGDDEEKRKGAETGQDERQLTVDFNLLRDLSAALRIDSRERFEVLVQRGANGAVGIVVTPFAPRGRIDFDRAAHQLFAELDELLDALLENRKLLCVIRLDDCFPFLHDVEDLFVEFEQPVAKLLGGRRIRRHVNAAGFHDHRIDQRVDALDAERGAICGLDSVRELDVLARVVVRQRGDRRGYQAEQRENRIELGGERKPGCHGGKNFV